MNCFVISPIGEEGSEVRAHADEVFDHLIEPALSEFDIQAIRSDRMNEPGKISDQMYRAIFGHDLCIAVLTFANPNVYYELAIAQSAGRPVIILVEKGTRLPFDVADLRTLTYDLRISSYKNRTHINRLALMLQELKQADWRGQDVFRQYRTQPALDAQALVATAGVTIQNPDGTAPIERMDISGTFDAIPEGYELRALRYYPSNDNYIPYGKVVVDRIAKTWRVSGFDIGGESGAERGIYVALVGSSAKLLLDYFQIAAEAHHEVHKELRESTGKIGRYLPSIAVWPDDLHVCVRRMVRRK
jgi:hypothetical protein